MHILKIQSFRVQLIIVILLAVISILVQRLKFADKKIILDDSEVEWLKINAIILDDFEVECLKNNAPHRFLGKHFVFGTCKKFSAGRDYR